MKFKKIFSNELKVEDVAGNRPQAPSDNSKSLSFKEQLVLVADEYRTNLDIKENINKIKAKLKEVAIYRKFSIYLYKVKPKSSLTLGGCDLKSISLFVPTGVTLAEYTILMTDALIEELGFSRSDISWQTDSTSNYDSCRLIVTW